MGVLPGSAIRSLRLDESGFESEMAKQRTRAQASWKKAETAKVAAVYAELSKSVRSEFAGYGAERLDDVRATALLVDGNPVETLEAGVEGEVVEVRMVAIRTHEY